MFLTEFHSSMGNLILLPILQILYYMCYVCDESLHMVLECGMILELCDSLVSVRQK